MTRYCCGFGHRDVYENIDNELYDFVLKAIDMGCTTFYVGNNGEFDSKLARAVRIAKQNNKNVKLVLVLPYMKNDLNKNKDYYYGMYDDIIIPTELADIHYKQAITKRNQWMIDNSDIVITYVRRDFGGAFNAQKYAEKSSKLLMRV